MTPHLATLPSRAECEKQVSGYRGCEHKKFFTREEAEAFINRPTRTVVAEYYGNAPLVEPQLLVRMPPTRPAIAAPGPSRSYAAVTREEVVEKVKEEIPVQVELVAPRQVDAPAPAPTAPATGTDVSRAEARKARKVARQAVRQAAVVAAPAAKKKESKRAKKRRAARGADGGANPGVHQSCCSLCGHPSTPSLAMATVFVTGSSRGVGLGIVKELASKPDIGLVLASARDPQGSKELSELIASSDGKIKAVKLDTDSDDSINVSAVVISSLAVAIADVVSVGRLLWRRSRSSLRRGSTCASMSFSPLTPSLRSKHSTRPPSPDFPPSPG